MKTTFRICFQLCSVLLLNANLQASNCIPAGTTLTLSRQSQIDSFPINYPDCDTPVGNLFISGNDVVNLNGLHNLKHIAHTLTIESNPNLINLSGLDNMEYINDLVIMNNNSLLSLNGLNKLNGIYTFELNNNDKLVNLVGLDNLNWIEYFEVSFNDSLHDFLGLNKLKRIGSTFRINENLSLKNFIGLDSISRIYGFTLFRNPLLKNLIGLESLRRLESLIVQGNNSFENFIGIDSIHQIEQGCWIANNNSLVNFYGLHNVDKFNGSFEVSENASILNFIGLNKVKYINSFEVINNPSLINFNGLNNLDTVVFTFKVSNNSALKNFEGLQNFMNMGWGFFEILNNNSLCSINQLNKNLFLDDPFVSIKNNPNLSCCKIMDTILANNLTVSSVNISNNATGCNNITEIKTITTQACCNEKYTFLKDTLCQGESIIFNNQTLTTRGTYYDTITNNGIDSIIILNLTVHPKSYQIVNKNLCVGQQFTLSNGRIITANGTYKDSIPNICDSIIEYRVSFVNNIIVNKTATVCQGKNYILPKGNSVNTIGIYKDTLRASFGCDSIIITNLTITKPTPFTNIVSICKGKSYTLPNGNSVSVSGTYYDTIRILNSCDSIVITNLTINPYLQSSQTNTICLGKTYTLPSGHAVTQSGIYNDTIQNNNGCDSIIITNLTETNPIPFVKKDSICNGQTYNLPSGKTTTIAGIYSDTIKKQNMCDSIITTTLSVFPNTFSIQLNAIDSIDAGTSIELKPTYTNDIATNWNWSPATNLSCIACENPIANPSQNTSYLVKAKTQSGCEDTAQTTIVVKQVEVYIPTAFSPNNDGINDELTVIVNNPVAFHIAIFNRWNQLLFESNKVNIKWNGLYKNQEQPVDEYFYVLDVTSPNGKQHHKQGTITLLR